MFPDVPKSRCHSKVCQVVNPIDFKYYIAFNITTEESLIMPTSISITVIPFQIYIDAFNKTHSQFSYFYKNNRALSVIYPRSLILDFFRLRGHPRFPRRYVLDPPTNMRKISLKGLHLMIYCKTKSYLATFGFNSMPLALADPK